MNSAIVRNAHLRGKMFIACLYPSHNSENFRFVTPASKMQVLNFLHILVLVVFVAKESIAFSPTYQFTGKKVDNALSKSICSFQQCHSRSASFALRMQTNWEEAKDPATGKMYWYNTKTLETTWESPFREVKDAKKDAPFSPEAAASTFEMMGKFTQKLSEYKACADPIQKRALRLEILSIYTEFAVPSLSLAIGTFISFPGAFAIVFIALQASGRGLADVQALLAPVPFASEALSHIDPALGSAAIAAVVVELASPALILAAVAIKGAVESRLRERLPQWGLDADGIARRLDALAGGEEADLL
jgi:hypothetical protein